MAHERGRTAVFWYAVQVKQFVHSLLRLDAHIIRALLPIFIALQFQQYKRSDLNNDWCRHVALRLRLACAGLLWRTRLMVTQGGDRFLQRQRRDVGDVAADDYRLHSRHH